MIAVTVKPCGCVANKRSAGVEIPRNSPSGVVRIMSEENANRLPMLCPAHRPKVSEPKAQESLF